MIKHTPQKILFCDWDGVLNSSEYHERRVQLQNEGKIRLDPSRPEEYFDHVAVARLNKIIDQTGCSIVVTSGRRWCFDSMERLRGFMARGGVYSDAVWGRTPVSPWRYQEVLGWLQPQAKTIYTVKTWAIVDDDFGPLGDIPPGFLVSTDKRTGLLDSHVDQLISILNSVNQ